MLFNLSKLIFLFSIFQQLLFANADDSVRFITSDGVVYSYAVITSTIKPATVVVRTSSYTTTRVKAITLENNQVTSTTEEIATEATVTSSVDVDTESPAPTTTSSTSSTSSSTTSTANIVSTLQPVNDLSSKAVIGATTPSTSVIQKTTQSSTSSSTTTSVNLVQNSAIDADAHTTSTLTPSTSKLTTTSPTTTSVSSTSSSQTASPTTSVEDGTCYVFYDDADDEYYSTFYITDSSMTVDAATTLTSTQVVYATMTL